MARDVHDEREMADEACGLREQISLLAAGMGEVYEQAGDARPPPPAHPA